MSCKKLILRRRFQRALVCIFIIVFLFILATFERCTNNCANQIDYPFVIINKNNVSSSGYDEIRIFNPSQSQSGSSGNNPTFEESAYISQAVMEIKNLPEPPFILGRQRNGPRFLKRRNCARFPTLYDIQFNNVHWQVQFIGNATFYLFSAYYDNRSIIKATPSIRILAMTDQLHVNRSGICQLWFKNETSPVVTWVREFFNIWYRKWSTKGVYNAYLLTCKIPKSHIGKIPVSVSIVEDICTNATNNIRIHHDIVSVDRESQKLGKFGVCVKGLDMLHDDNYDKSVRLIEWIELLSVIGADKIFFYEFSTHPNVKKVLDYYVQIGKVDVTPLSMPGNLPNDPRLRHLFLGKKSRAADKRKNEVIPYNDCLYRNMNSFQYLAVLDTDEVIVPKLDFNWNEMINNYELNRTKNLTERPSTTWCFRNVYFLDDMTVDRGEDSSGVPNHLHMLKHVYRSSNYTPPKTFIKCMHATDRTLTVHNHLPLSCLPGGCEIHHVDPDIAHMQHYRSKCVDDIKDCETYKLESVPDTTIWKYKDEVIRRVNDVMYRLNIAA